VETQTSDHLVGRLLDRRYRVGARIARGGMATVYEALDTRLDRVVALKVMHGGLGDDADFARKFVQEARAAAKLSHPNVVAVFDQGDDDGTLFLAMEYVPGQTLRDLMRQQGPLPPARALDLLSPVLSALSAAHDAGIVHRDIKPENVLIAADGKVKVADFGLARAVSATGNTATNGLLIGTVSYLAPELVTDGRADARSDVYSAGIMLYELLTGVKPHSGDSPIQVAYRHVHADVPAPSKSRPGIPPYVDALVQRATARSRDLRPADARVFAQQVRRVRSALDEGLPDDPDLTGDLTVPILLPPDDPEPEASGFDDGWRDGRFEPVRSDTLVVEHHLDRPVNGTPPARKGPPPPPQRRRGRGPIALIAVLALAAGIGGAAWYYGVQRFTTAPSLVNLTQAQAQTRAQAAGLQTEIGGQAFSETVRPGSVVSTDPSPDGRILKNGTIKLFVSKGPERYRVPKLTGMDQDSAGQQLTTIHLAVGQIAQIYSESVPPGRVISQKPVFNTVVKRDTRVNLVVSKGKRPIEVPDQTGKSAKQASRTLRKLGFEVKASLEFSDTVPQGRVISQDPNSGTRFAKDTITLVVSRGPEVRDIPRVRGLSPQKAEERLKEAGFRINVQRDRLYFGLNLVVNQSPAGGTKAKAGTVVTVLIV
jgi:eukaryotic-like serine/threonine-protein kinase